jgi:oligosaccharide repeat unit polymerase
VNVSSQGGLRLIPALPAAVVEVLLLFVAVFAGAIAFIAGWLTPNQGVVLTALLLLVVLVLSWKNLNYARHPCFLFLCVLLLVQGGRLLAYLLGSEPDPLRVRVQAPFPFDLTHEQQGTVLLCLALSAVCIYAVCRVKFRHIPIPDTSSAREYLPYLYLLFWLSVPVQIFKNYSYYQYAADHGGYIYFWVNHGEFAASVPFWVRLISLVTLPAFVGIFVIEKRTRYLVLTTATYLISSVLTLLMGSRMGTLTLIIGLWYAAGIKSGKKPRMALILLLALALFLIAGVFQALREESDTITAYAIDPVKFVILAGNSLDVTEVAVKYRDMFSPHAGTYLADELTFAFVPRDSRHYIRGHELAQDISVFLNPVAYEAGVGTAGSYIAEAYVVGGFGAVIIASLLIGYGLHLAYCMSQKVLGLAIVVMLMPDFLSMPRGDLLDWLSVLARICLLLLVIAAGWKVYSALLWLKRTPRRAHPWMAGRLPGMQ